MPSEELGFLVKRELLEVLGQREDALYPKGGSPRSLGSLARAPSRAAAVTAEVILAIWSGRELPPTHTPGRTLIFLQ